MDNTILSEGRQRLPVITLNSIGCIYDPPNVLRVLEVCRQPVPVGTPTLDDNRIFFAPLALKVVKSLLRSILADSLVDKFKVLHELLLVLACHVLDGVAYLMHDAQLYRGLGKDARDGIGKALEACHYRCTSIMIDINNTKGLASSTSII